MFLHPVIDRKASWSWAEATIKDLARFLSQMGRVHQLQYSFKALRKYEVSAKANYDSKLQIVSNLSFETCNENSTSLFRMNNLAHAFITVSSIRNIFVVEIFSSGTLSRIHAPHRTR